VIPSAVFQERLRRPLAASCLGATFMLLTIAPALAHPPYEHAVAKLARSDGTELSVIKTYVDGILSVDPVQLVVRDGAEHTLDETRFSRDIVASCDRIQCVVYRYESALSLAPAEVFAIHDGNLVPVADTPASLAGWLSHTREHAIGYAASTTTLVLVVTLFKQVRRTSRWRSAACASAGLVLLLIWWHAVYELSRLSVSSAVMLGAVVGIVSMMLGSATRRSKRAD
jgi:hypothetical protein